MSESEYERIVLKHYSKNEVQNEIVQYSRNRWLALHCEVVNPQGYQVLLRYQGAGRDRPPLTVARPEDIVQLLERYKGLKPRTFYASISVYNELARAESVRDPENILFCSPVWDIDNTLGKWKVTIDVAREIVTFLEQEGVSKSVFLKWSGNGSHVHLHERAFSPKLLSKIVPLDAAYAVVEYVNRKLKAKFAEITRTSQSPELNIENETDIQRVFTCPLSLHRNLDSVAVCVPPEKIDDFSPDWTRIETYRHWQEWNQFEVGEADRIAEKAYRSVGAYKMRTATRAEPKQATDSIVKWLKTD